MDMISVCIPIYNQNVSNLVHGLSAQLKSLNKGGEILLIDDCSDKIYKEPNKFNEENIIYRELDKNVGRAKIRNLFVKYARYDYLLFIDCDSTINSEDFIAQYFKAVETNPDLVCGGSVYEKTKPPKEKLLRWKYGTFRESHTADIRNRFPNKSFKTNNFIIKKKIFEKVRFNERITEYGHEDTLFGHSLKKNDIAVLHINNPVINGNLESNKEFLEKTEKAVISLIKIMHFPDFDSELTNDIRILRVYNKIKNIALPVRLTYHLTKPMIIYLLSNGYANLRLLEFFKLGTLLTNLKNT
jgi:glycosyltransferase involved in cell wall biosynthesis